MDLTKVFEAAQAYVMLSRVQELEQLYILNLVPSEKIYPSSQALEELKRMNEIALNKKNIMEACDDRIISINIRSLRSHFEDLINEAQIANCDVLLVQQTCLEISETTGRFKLANYSSHFNSRGNGKGLALFFKSKFTPVLDVTEDGYQMSKLESEGYDVISVYRSSDSNSSNKQMFTSVLLIMVNVQKTTFILGDFNCDLKCDGSSVLSREIIDFGFSQLVKEPTHNQGGIIDHCYTSKNVIPNNVKLSQKAVYYSDHDLLEVQYKCN